MTTVSQRINGPNSAVTQVVRRQSSLKPPPPSSSLTRISNRGIIQPSADDCLRLWLPKIAKQFERITCPPRRRRQPLGLMLLCFFAQSDGEIVTILTINFQHEPILVIESNGPGARKRSRGSHMLRVLLVMSRIDMYVCETAGGKMSVSKCLIEREEPSL